MNAVTDQLSHDVVIVDDDRLTLERVRRLFRGTNHNVHCFSEVSAARAYMQDHDASLLIVDQRMPQMNGFEFIQEMQKTCDLEDSELILYSAMEIPAALREAAEKKDIQAIAKDRLTNQQEFLKLIARRPR